MAHTLYTFNFLETISHQLHEALDALPVTTLDDAHLQNLYQVQARENAAQGVYFLHLDGSPFYLGKADNVAERLGNHLEKLRGREGIDASQAGYKAILLDKSMSTAANEKILIKLFTGTHKGMWNGKGFGPKDPGQERDTTKPSKFDKQHPINVRYPIPSHQIEPVMTIGALFATLKSTLPYLFRSELDEENAQREVNLSGLDMTARTLLMSAVAAMTPGWQGAILHYGMVVYKTDKNYKYAMEVFKSPEGS